MNWNSWADLFPTFANAASRTARFPWTRWLSWVPFLASVGLTGTVWIVTLVAMIMTFAPPPPGFIRLDVVGQIEAMRMLLNVALPLGVVAVVASVARPVLPVGARVIPMFLLTFSFVAACALALCFWQCLDWLHGSDFNLWSIRPIWWVPVP